MENIGYSLIGHRSRCFDIRVSNCSKYAISGKSEYDLVLIYSPPYCNSFRRCHVKDMELANQEMHPYIHAQRYMRGASECFYNSSRRYDLHVSFRWKCDIVEIKRRVGRYCIRWTSGRLCQSRSPISWRSANIFL